MEDDEPIYETKIYIKFHKIGHVDTKQQQFAATIEVRATWRIPLIPSQAAIATFLTRHDHERHIGFQLVRISRLSFCFVCLTYLSAKCSNHSRLWFRSAHFLAIVSELEQMFELIVQSFFTFRPPQFIV